MLLSLLSWSTPVQALSVLFIGNSHTSTHDVPAMVWSLHDRTARVRCESITGGILNDHLRDGRAARVLAASRFDIVILQGAAMSSSHRHTYPQDGAHSLARLAKKRGSRVILFPEWPRRGWKETPYILGIYGSIAKAEQIELADVPSAFDRALKGRPQLDLWSPDGNHSSLPGAYLAAAVLARKIAPGQNLANWRPSGLSSELASYLRAASRAKAAGEGSGRTKAN